MLFTREHDDFCKCSKSKPTPLRRGISVGSVTSGMFPTRPSGSFWRSESQNGGSTARLQGSKASKSSRRLKTAEPIPKSNDAASPERPKRRYWDARSLPNLAFDTGKQQFLQMHQIRFRRHFGEAFPLIRCLLGRIRLALQGPFGAPEPSKGSKVQLGRPAWRSKGANVLEPVTRGP